MTRVLPIVLLALFGCSRSTASGSASASTPADGAASNPAPKVEADPEPVPKSEEPLVEREFAESRKYRGDETEALYRFEGDDFTTDLEMRVVVGKPEDPTGIYLGHPEGAPAVITNGPHCGGEFYEGDSLSAQILDHGPVLEGRHRLLEIWISCRQGEDIVSVDSVVWLVLDDGRSLSLFWQGTAGYHGSWVCATYDQLEFVLEGDAVVLTQSEVGEIHEPGIEEYDCEEAREYVEARGTERIPLPKL
jgi:hypothetical protein